MFVIGTAGHVDHGKSTLVKALTGIDPDRLLEEKEREMTIDLGFAWLRLPSGREVSIIDVPGHERFIKNMLAGVGGIDAALFVVAADEGVMPQTREHLAILDLLRVKAGVVALTKKDLVEEEWLELVRSDVGRELEGTFLSSAPIIPLSAISGEGLPELLEALDTTLDSTAPRLDLGRPRLAIDRVFTVAGFGTVVTGTLIDGSLRIGQEVEVQPGQLRARIRGLQTHRHKVEVAQPSSRVAVNLAGIDHEQLQRGDVVTSPGWLQPSRVVDVRLKLLDNAPHPLQHNATMSFHTGAAEAQVRVRLLDVQTLEPGQVGWAQLRLSRPLATTKGDLFILRTPNTTIGGGEIVALEPKRHRRFHGPTLAGLEALAQGSPDQAIIQALNEGDPSAPVTIAQRCHLSEQQVHDVLGHLISEGAVVQIGSSFTTQKRWGEVHQHIVAAVQSYHYQHPYRLGMPKEELRSRAGLVARLFDAVLPKLVQEGEIVEQGSRVRLAGYQVTLSPAQQQKVDRLFETLRQSRYTPPNRTELEQILGLEHELAESLVEQGVLVRVDEEILYLPEVYQEIVEMIKAHIHAEGSITVAELRDLLQASRKYTLAILEHLDQTHVTRRVGDARVLR